MKHITPLHWLCLSFLIYAAVAWFNWWAGLGAYVGFNLIYIVWWDRCHGAGVSRNWGRRRHVR